MNTIEFMKTVNRLKSVRRTGWVERGVKEPESVADHSCMMALMAMALPGFGEGVDRGKAARMALIHDLAEAETGDIITKENWKEKGTMHAEEKSALERETIIKLCSNLEEKTAKEIVSLWEEFEKGKSKEAILVNDLDTAEMMIQAGIYSKTGNFKKPLEGFWDGANMGRIRDESIKTLVKRIIGEGR